jgi:hypothetical protein
MIIVAICVLSQLYLLFFVYKILEEIEISKNIHKVLLSVSIGINFIIVLYALSFFYLR